MSSKTGTAQQARARLESAQIELLSTQAQSQRWRTALMHWMGVPVLPEVVGNAPDALANACMNEAVAPSSMADRDTSAVRLAQAQVESARSEAEIARTQLLPTFSLEATGGRGLNSRSRGADERSIDTTVMLNVSMPLYEGGRLQSDRRSAEYAVTAALEDARLNAEQGGKDVLIEWRKFVARQPVQTAREESMRMTRTLYREQYLQLGSRSLLDLLNAEQEYFSARRDQIDSTHEMMRLSIDCLYYAGSLQQVFAAPLATTDSIIVPRQAGGWR